LKPNGFNNTDPLVISGTFSCTDGTNEAVCEQVFQSGVRRVATGLDVRFVRGVQVGQSLSL
jgi:hypothetical protein